MLCGEDWNDVMQDAMQLEDCYQVLVDITVGVTNGAGVTKQVTNNAQTNENCVQNCCCFVCKKLVWE